MDVFGVLQMSDQPPDSLGPLCQQLGITKENLFEDLANIDPAEFTNGHLYELGKHIQEVKVPWKSVQEALGRAYPTDWSKMTPYTLAEKFVGM